MGSYFSSVEDNGADLHADCLKELRQLEEVGAHKEIVQMFSDAMDGKETFRDVNDKFEGIALFESVMDVRRAYPNLRKITCVELGRRGHDDRWCVALKPGTDVDTGRK